MADENSVQKVGNSAEDLQKSAEVSQTAATETAEISQVAQNQTEEKSSREFQNIGAPDIEKLFAAGAHFGHKSARWNPKMREFIHSKRGDSHIINLEKTVEQLEKALPFLSEIAAAGRQILFVGTKKQAREITKSAAEFVNMPYVSERWLGGMLTNQSTMVSQIKKLKLLEKKMASGELANRYNKLEVQRFQEEIDALNQKYGGVKELRGKPGAVFVLDAVADMGAVREAEKLNIPVVAVCDTNADPTGIKFVIPANDDAIATLDLIANYAVDAVRAGEAKIVKKAADEKIAKPTALAAKAE